MTRAAVFAALAFLTACGAAPPMDAPAPSPEADAAPDATGSQTTPDATGVDGGTMKGDGRAPDSATPEAAPIGQEAASPEAAAVEPDAGTTTPEAAPPAEPGNDAAPALCPAPSATCATVNAADAAIRSQFPPTRYACTDGARLCGEVNDQGTPITYAMVCREGAWRFAGSYSAGTWYPLYQCSRGCGAVGKTCAP